MHFRALLVHDHLVQQVHCPPTTTPDPDTERESLLFGFVITSIVLAPN